MARNATFTPASIDALSKGNLRDPRTPGLMIEVLPSRKKVWKYERRMPGNGALVRLSFGLFPANTMADARTWAAALHDQLEAGIDPREARRAREAQKQARRGRARLPGPHAQQPPLVPVEWQSVVLGTNDPDRLDSGR